MRVRPILAALLCLAVVGSGCGDSGAPADTEGSPATTTTTRPPAGRSVVLMTHDSFAVSDSVLDAFTTSTGIEVEILRAGDAGSMVNQAVLTKDNPLADVLFGIDTTFLSRALEAGIFEPYMADGLDTVPTELAADDSGMVTPIDFGDVCLNYDKAAFAAAGIDPPATLSDLTKARYRGMLVVENPATSSPGLAFLLATIAAFGEGSWQDFWSDLKANDVLVTSGWEEAYYGAFSAASDGDRPLVVSYASSPPAEVIFAETPLDEAPTAVITDGCFRQVEYAGILAGTDARPAAELLIDFMLSPTFQEDIPLNMFVFPANAEAQLPPEFIRHTTLPEAPLRLDPLLIEQRRSEWVETWTDIVLR